MNPITVPRGVRVTVSRYIPPDAIVANYNDQYITVNNMPRAVAPNQLVSLVVGVDVFRLLRFEGEAIVVGPRGAWQTVNGE